MVVFPQISKLCTFIIAREAACVAGMASIMPCHKFIGHNYIAIAMQAIAIQITIQAVTIQAIPTHVITT